VGSGGPAITDSNPLLRGLRGDPPYSALLAKMNLPPD